MQREQVMQRLAGVRERLEKKGVGAAFHRVAKADPVGDMGFLGSMILHGILSGSIDELMGDLLPIGHDGLTGDLSSSLTIGGMEGLSLLSEAQEDRHIRRPSASFYPLGRRKEKVKDTKASKKFNRAAAATGRNARFSYDVQTDLAHMFELTDMLNTLEGQEAQEISLNNSRWVNLAIRKSSPGAAPGGVERRRHPRPAGFYNA